MSNSPKVQVPTSGTNGQNSADYEKYVVVDTNGVLVGEGQVAYSLDLIKDGTQEARADFLTQLFGAVGMEFKVRTPRADKVAKKVSVNDILAQVAKGN